MSTSKPLTKRQQQVLTALTRAERPLSAYALLDDLRDSGFRVPLQVYRALNALIKAGLVHKLESINAFIACTHRHPHKHGLAAFTICDECGQANEFSDAIVDKQLAHIADNAQFDRAHTIIEMRGLCGSCRG